MKSKKATNEKTQRNLRERLLGTRLGMVYALLQERCRFGFSVIIYIRASPYMGGWSLSTFGEEKGQLCWKVRACTACSF